MNSKNTIRTIATIKEDIDKLLLTKNIEHYAVVYAMTMLELQLKKIIIYNYRCSGLSAKFIRHHLISKKTFSQLCEEFEWCEPNGLKLKSFQLKYNNKKIDINGLSKLRNKVAHGETTSINDELTENLKIILYTIESFADIFKSKYEYDGISPLPSKLKKSKIITNKRIISNL
jgi:hypothetical protein